LLRWWCLASPDATEWPLTSVVNVSRESRYHHSYHLILYHSFSSIFRTLLSFRPVSLRCITNNDGNYEQNISPCCYWPWQYDHIDYYIPTLILHSENHRLVRVTKFIIFFPYRWLVLNYWQWFSVNNIISISSGTAWCLISILTSSHHSPPPPVTRSHRSQMARLANYSSTQNTFISTN
jgi:hypothetical protein